MKQKIFSLISLIALIIVFYSCKNDNVKNVEIDNWAKMEQILDSIKAPVFPDNTFNVLEYGAVADGVFNNTDIFKEVIKKCTESGGGKVIVPKGTYYTGPIHLDNNVHLHFEDGAELLFSTNPSDYKPLVHTSYEGTELFNYSPLIYAYKKTNIAITGNGVLNGQASNENWW